MYLIAVGVSLCEPILLDVKVDTMFDVANYEQECYER